MWVVVRGAVMARKRDMDPGVGWQVASMGNRKALAEDTCLCRRRQLEEKEPCRGVYVYRATSCNVTCVFIQYSTQVC